MLQFAILTALLFFNGPLFPGVQSITLTIFTDKEALIALKSRLVSSTEATPNVLPSWDKGDSSPCNWTGVACSDSAQRVVGLNLSGLGLSGSLSPSIGNLSFLESLQIQNNQFKGPIPDQIGLLFRLRVLNMSSNLMEGPIPSNISQLKELRILDLMTNQIWGRIPEGLTHLTELQVLNLGRNHISGPVPPELANVSSLAEINFGTNFISGTIPADLAHLRSLKRLDLTINNLTGTVPLSIYNMSSLVYIALASNQLRGKIPSDVGDTLPNLLGFNFCFNRFTGSIPGSLHNLTNLRIIRMAHNLLEGTVPPGLGNLPDLQMYNIGFNKIVNSGNDGLEFLNSLRNSTRLNFLAIDGNRFECPIPESIGNLSKELTHLYMGGNRIYGRIPASIGQLRGLDLLNLSYNSISGEIPPEIGQLGGLQMLGLAGNKLSGRIPESLGNLQKLNYIDLSGNGLAGRIPTSFGNFQQMLSMDLSNNRLNGSVPKEILNIPSLSTLMNLSRNSLSGPLPKEVEALQSIVTIDVSDNNLSGEIPTSIGNCKSLEELSMANNDLSGPVPATLVTVKGLESLDLSSNQLNGSIPADLQKLKALRLLNLSFNGLEGDVPNGGIFSNLSSVHLQGNPKLCLRSHCRRNRHHAKTKLLVITVVTVTIIVAVCSIIGSLFYIKKSRVKAVTPPESFKGQHPMVSYKELQLATAHFSEENLIGSGSFGSVYKGYLQEGVASAIKILDTERTGSRKSFIAECDALRNVRHRNLVKLITSCSSIDSSSKEFLALVYEFLSGGNLEEWIRGKTRHANGEGLNVLERLSIAIDVASALDYLHHDGEAPVVHCDLKPSNVLLDEDMTAKVWDFGLARLVLENRGDQPRVSSTIGLKGSIGYIPPEYGMGEKPSIAGDAYSYGVMLLELFTGKSPTHESFKGGLSLIKWVESAFPAKSEQVADPELLALMGQLYHGGHQIRSEAQQECVTAVLGIGLGCTANSPDTRTSMRDALCKLKSARDTLLKTRTSF